MKTSLPIRLAIAILMPAPLCVADPIRIETKIFESGDINIPHNLTELAKHERVTMMSIPIITSEAAKNGKIEIIKGYEPASITNSKFDRLNTGMTLSILPEQQGEYVSFTGSLTISKIVGEGSRDNQTQSDTITRTIYFSGKQKVGQESWFDLVNPTNNGQEEWIDLGKTKPANASLQKKITLWIRLDNKAEQDAPSNR